MGPLNGIRVLDLSSVLMGPYAAQIMGEYGAEVIKVEPPSGDVIRPIGPARNAGMGPLFMNANRCKRSIALDLKTEPGRAALLRLVAGADVLLTNVRPRAMERLDLGWEVLEAANPRLIYAALVGFDQRGPYAARPAYDDLIQGAACIPHSFTRAGHAPAYVPAAVADRVVGLSAVNAILSAIVARATSGRGQRVEVPMFETMLSMILGDHLGGLTYDPPLDQGGYARQLSPDRRPYQTSDGYVCALVYTDGHWERFFRAIGQPEMPAADPRFVNFNARMAHINEVYAELGRIMRTRTTAEWLELLEAADVPVMPMHSYETALDDPHLGAIGFFREVDHPSEGAIREMAVPAQFSRDMPQPGRAAPVLGADGRAVLAEAGMSAEEIDALIAAGALHLPNT